MSLMTLSELGIRSRRVPKWKQLLTELRQRGRSGYELRMLAEREVWDLGLTSGAARREASKLDGPLR